MQELSDHVEVSKRSVQYAIYYVTEHHDDLIHVYCFTYLARYALRCCVCCMAMAT